MVTEVGDAVRTVAYGISVRPDQLPSELLKLSLREDFAVLFELHRIIVEALKG